jgi:hypothetical protein
MVEQPQPPFARRELRIPRSFREHMGYVVGSCFLALFVVFFSVLAASHLWNFASTSTFVLIAAALWLLLVCLGVREGLAETGGIGASMTVILGAFSRDQFLDVVAQASGRRILRHGFRLFGLPLYYRNVPLDRVTLLKWGSGQATSLAGRDMNDWHVTIWYKPEPPEKPRYPMGRRPEEDLFIVGPSRAKSSTAAFGRDFVGFLVAAGLPIVQGENECSFVTCEEDGKSV